MENQSFLKSNAAWEKVQDPQHILEKTRTLLEKILKEYPDIKAIGLTGQMHGILYVDVQGKHVSPLYTWQDGRGNKATSFRREKYLPDFAGNLSKKSIYRL